jgi:cobalt-zinc-cadmium efflux system outer membrane protein
VFHWKSWMRARAAFVAGTVIWVLPCTASSSEEARTTAELEGSLAREATLETIVRVALAHNPELHEAEQRQRAAREGAPAASRLPDPEFEYQLWAQPVTRPLALGDAQMHMFGLSQTFPAPGTLGARSDAASAQADVAEHARRARVLDVTLRVRRAFVEYRRADSEYRIHLEHGRLAEQTLELARAAYQAGRGAQRDVLRAEVEIARLHGDVIGVEGERRSARALLNALMARRLDAPLGPPAPRAVASRDAAVPRAEGERGDRPELAAAASAVRARQHELAGTRSGGTWPGFMVGVQYMYMPMAEEPHNYGVTLSVSLPWLNPRYGEELRAAEARVSAERSALAGARNAADYERFAAGERLKTAEASLALLEDRVVPQVERSFESAQAAYGGGQGDALSLFEALRALLDVRIEHERAVARVEVALAEMDRASGVPPAGARVTKGATP